MNTKFKKILGVLFVLILALAACGGSDNYGDDAADDGGDYFEEAEANYSKGIAAESAAYDQAAEPFAPGADGVENSAGTNTTAQQRIVIKNADMSLVVGDPVQAQRAIAEMAENLGGFVVSSNLYMSYGNDGQGYQSASITVRVPSEHFSAVIDSLEGEAVEVQSKSVTGQDVTLQYTDLQSRLKNLEETSDQLQLIMDDAHRTEDVLAVYNQLVYINEQAETIRGQLKYYSESAAFSAIALNLVPEAVIQPVTIGKWEPKGVALDAIQALVNTSQRLADLVIWLTLYTIPVMLYFIAPLFIGWRIYKRFRKPKTAVVAKKKAPAKTKE